MGRVVRGARNENWAGGGGGKLLGFCDCAFYIVVWDGRKPSLVRSGTCRSRGANRWGIWESISGRGSLEREEARGLSRAGKVAGE